MSYPHWYGEESRRVVMPPEPAPKVEVRQCPMCECHSMVPLCFYHWKGRLPEADTKDDFIVAARGTSTKRPCDIFACFVCTARMSDDRVWLPGPDDLVLELFQDSERHTTDRQER